MRSVPIQGATLVVIHDERDASSREEKQDFRAEKLSVI